MTCNDKDLIWMNEKIKSYMNSKTQLYKTYIKDCRNEIGFLNRKNYITELKEMVSISKVPYYENIGKKLYIQQIKLNPTGLFLKRFMMTKSSIITPLLINDKTVFQKFHLFYS